MSLNKYSPRISVIAIFWFVFSCAPSNTRAYIECKVGRFNLSIPRSDLVFLACDGAQKEITIINLKPNKDTRLEVRSYKGSIKYIWQDSIYSGPPYRTVSSYKIYCLPGSVPYRCGSFVRDYQFPFHVSWRDAESMTDRQIRDSIAEMKNYLNRSLLHGDDSSADGHVPR